MTFNLTGSWDGFYIFFSTFIVRGTWNTGSYYVYGRIHWSIIDSATINTYWHPSAYGQNSVFTRADSGGLPMTDSQFNWTAPVWPNWNARKAEFQYLASPELQAITSPPEPGSSAFSGLWGEARLGIGGLWFGVVVADFSASPLSGNPSLIVDFQDLSAGSPVSWDWDFGDGSPHSTVQNPTHTYTVVGKYTVTLRAYKTGDSDTITKIDYISVVSLAPPKNFRCYLNKNNRVSFKWDKV